MKGSIFLSILLCACTSYAPVAYRTRNERSIASDLESERSKYIERRNREEKLDREAQMAMAQRVEQEEERANSYTILQMVKREQQERVLLGKKIEELQSSLQNIQNDLLIIKKLLNNNKN